MKHRFVYLALLVVTMLSASCSEMPLLEDMTTDLRDNPADPEGEAFEQSWKVVGAPAVATSMGMNVSLAIGEGVPYVAFADGTWVRVRKLDRDAWTLVGTNDINIGMGITDLDIAVRGTAPYVVYKPNTYQPECKYLSGANWANVGPTSFAPSLSLTPTFSDPSMVLTPDKVFIAYNDTDVGYVARYDGAAWSHFAFTDGNGDHEAIDLAYYDSKLFVSFTNNYAGVNRAVSVRTTPPTWPPAWSYLFKSGNVAITTPLQEASAIAFSGGMPYVASMITGTIKVIRNTAPDVWEDAGTNPVANNGFKPKMAVDPDGVVYVAYKDQNSGNKITVKKLVGSTWVVVGQAGFSGKVGASLDFAISPADGKLYVAYDNEDNGNKVQVMAFY